MDKLFSPCRFQKISYILFILIFLIFLSFAVFCTGCMAPHEPAEAAQDNTRAAGIAVSLPGTVLDVPGVPAAGSSKRELVNVLRNESLTAAGSVGDTGITEVQVWMLDGNISSMMVPVGADGTFMVTFDSSQTAALARNFSSSLVIHYPSSPDNFSVVFDPVSGKVSGTDESVPAEILAEINSGDYYPTTLEDYLDQAISDSGTGNSCNIYILNAVDAWIDINPVEAGPAGTTLVSGTTSLPPGTELTVDIFTVSMHPTPKNYDYSHEFAEGSTVVVAGTDNVNTFSASVDTLLLNSGKYIVVVGSMDDYLQAEEHIYADIIATVEDYSGRGNYINWSALELPDLVVNMSIEPEMLGGEWHVVPPGTSTRNNEVEYGSIIDFGADGICRVFDSSGVQILAVYDSNEAHLTQVPNGAMMDSRSVGNVTFIKLGGEVILTKIDEYPDNV